MSTASVLIRFREENFSQHEVDAVAMWIKKSVARHLSFRKFLKIKPEDVNIVTEACTNGECPVNFIVSTLDFPNTKLLKDHYECSKKKIAEDLRILVKGILRIS